MNCISSTAASSEIDEEMQGGYSFMMKNKTVEACNKWENTWNLITSTMDSNGYESIEDFDEDFKGQQNIYNWASDYECELGNALLDDTSFAQKRIDFCSEYLKRYSNKNDFNIGGMKSRLGDGAGLGGLTSLGCLRFLKIGIMKKPLDC